MRGGGGGNAGNVVRPLGEKFYFAASLMQAAVSQVVYKPQMFMKFSVLSWAALFSTVFILQPVIDGYVCSISHLGHGGWLKIGIISLHEKQYGSRSRGYFENRYCT